MSSMYLRQGELTIDPPNLIWVNTTILLASNIVSIVIVRNTK